MSSQKKLTKKETEFRGKADIQAAFWRKDTKRGEKDRSLEKQPEES